jgi:hypothetical protein
MFFLATAKRPAKARSKLIEQTNTRAMRDNFIYDLLKAIAPIPTAAHPIVMSSIAIIISTIFSDSKPQQTPLASGIHRQNFGSLTD